MAELAFIATIVGLAATALSSTKLLFEMVDQVRNSPVELSALSNDVHSFHDIITSVHSAIDDPTVAELLQKDRRLHELVAKLQGPLRNCSAILIQLRSKLRTFLKPVDGGGFRISNVDIRWCFKRNDFMDCTSRLEATKTTLNAALMAVIFYCSLRSAGKGLEMPQPSEPSFQSSDTDIGTALRDYAESITSPSPVQHASSGPDMTSSESLMLDLHSLSISSEVPAEKISAVQQVPNNPAIRLRSFQHSYYDFHRAARKDDGASIQLMIQEGYDVDISAPDKTTALHLAAGNGCEEVVGLLLSYSARVDVVSKRKWGSLEARSTPLHWAAKSGSEDIINGLLNNHADIAARDKIGRTALQISIIEHHGAAAMLLIQRGTPLQVSGDEPWSALHGACYRGFIDVVNMMLERCKSEKCFSSILNATDDIGRMPIHIAARSGHCDIVRALIEAGVDVNARNPRTRQIPLSSAAGKGQIEVMKYLISQGADRQHRSRFSFTALEILTKEYPKKVDEYTRFVKEWEANEKSDR